MLLKRLFDYSLAVFGIFISLPLWLLCAILIFIQDGLPIFYAQERVGRNARLFKGYKFRSMIKNAEENIGPVQSEKGDLRVTRIGRILRISAMDELPQLFNIARGDMSFVGPRALRPIEKEVNHDSTKSIFDFKGFKERSLAVPGLTGIAQIFSPRDIPREEKFKYDIWYIKNRSFLLDAYLIFISFIITFEGKWETRKERFYSLGANLKSRINKELD